VKKFLKSVKNWQNYGHKSVAPFFWPTLYIWWQLKIFLLFNGYNDDSHLSFARWGWFVIFHLPCSTLVIRLFTWPICLLLWLWSTSTQWNVAIVLLWSNHQYIEVDFVTYCQLKLHRSHRKILQSYLPCFDDFQKLHSWITSIHK